MNIKNKRGNSGFTLIELSVALSVGAVILVMLAISLVGVNSILKDKKFTSIKLNDISGIKSDITKINDKYELLDYNSVVNSDKTSLIFKKNGVSDNEIKLRDKWLIENDNKVAHYQSIEKIEFYNVDNLIMCEMQFFDKTKLRILI